MSNDRDTLNWAIKGLETEAAQYRERANQCEIKARDLRGRLRTLAAESPATAADISAFEAPAGVPTTTVAPRRHVSDEARRKQSERMRQRWAERRKSTSTKQGAKRS
jgi:hypothetical protein